MQLKITWKYCLAFIALNFLIGELHEQAHIQTGYFTCGCYGPRDFNFWSTCDQCAKQQWAWLATLAGPMFSYVVMGTGAYWFSRSANDNKRMIGFSILFASLPFARIFTALVGGGDEKVVIQALLGDSSNSIGSKVIASALVLLVCLPPMIIAGKTIINRNRWAIIAGFAIIPLLYGMLYQRMFLNRLLKNNMLSEVHVLGTPDLILVHTALLFVLLLLLRKGILQLRSNYAVARSAST